MTIKYSRESKNPSKACKAQGVDLRVHYKNTYETAQAIKGMSLSAAKQYLQDVCDKKRCVVFRKYRGTIGRTPQAKEFKATQGRWPVKSAKIVLGLLRNAESNAEFKNLDSEKLYVEHIQVNAAQQGRRRTYRAHGRIGPYMNCPCHVEMILSEKEETVEKAAEDVQPKKFTRKQFAKLRLKVGGDQWAISDGCWLCGLSGCAVEKLWTNAPGGVDGTETRTRTETGHCIRTTMDKP